LYRQGVVNKNILRIAAFCALGIASSAIAEEMATPPSSFVTARVPYLAWSGLYFGINGGYAWSTPSVSYVANDPASQAGTAPFPAAPNAFRPQISTAMADCSVARLATTGSSLRCG
jgi:hypothetical protein